jgi:hypothetical protein
MARKWSDEDLILAVKESKSFTDVIRKLGLLNYGANGRH